LLLGHPNGQIVFHDTATGDVKEELAAEDQPIKAVAFSPDGATIAWAARSHLRIWQLDPARELAHHHLGRTHYLSVAFHPSGRFLATVNGDGKADFWDAHTGAHRKGYDWKVGKLHDVVFDPTGDRAACCSKTGEIILWDVDE
jgi:WD40 repeat protein